MENHHWKSGLCPLNTEIFQFVSHSQRVNSICHFGICIRFSPDTFATRLWSLRAARRPQWADVSRNFQRHRPQKIAEKRCLLMSIGYVVPLVENLWKLADGNLSIQKCHTMPYHADYTTACFGTFEYTAVAVWMQGGIVSGLNSIESARWK